MQEPVLIACVQSLASKTHTVWCQRCGKHTQGGKPFCSKHLFDNPYARVVRQRRYLLDSALRRGIASSAVCREIDAALFNLGGVVGLGRLARVLNIDFCQVTALVPALLARGYMIEPASRKALRLRARKSQHA